MVSTTTRDVPVPDESVVERLLQEQFPRLADEGVRRSPASGSSNWVFRIGERHAARLPRTDAYAADVVKEARWVPRLAPQLPVPVPDLVHVGGPSTLFPRPWTVVTWIAGDMPGDLGQAEQAELAGGLGRFVRALHDVDTAGQRPGPSSWGYRCGEPVTDTIDEWADEAAQDLSDLFDPRRVRQAWRKIRDVPPPSMPPCWVHTDLSAENLLVGRQGGELSGVIDFGALGVGDRSIDLLYAWSLFDRPARELLRSASGVDDGTWLRARAWAFVGPGLRTIQDYRQSMPERTARLTAMVERIAGEVEVRLR